MSPVEQTSAAGAVRSPGPTTGTNGSTSCPATSVWFHRYRDRVLGACEVVEFDTQVPLWSGRTATEPAEILSIFGRPGERMNVRSTPPHG